MSCLIGDIGGTNCRLATWDTRTHAIENQRVYPTTQFYDLAAAISHFKAEIGVPGFDRGCVAIANPVDGDHISMTNTSWEFSIQDTRERLHLERLALINDWESIGYALSSLTEGGLKPLIRQCESTALGKSPVVLTGVGTGLGGALVVHGPQGQPIPIAGESGHMSYAPTEGIDIEIYRYLRMRFGHVSFERILSGPGIENIKDALESITQTSSQIKTTPEIVEAARTKSDRLCEETLQIFTRNLGSFVGNLALTANAKGGIYLGGGVLQKIGDGLCIASLSKGLTAKGRLGSALENIPVFLITDENAALKGCINYLTHS